MRYCEQCRSENPDSASYCMYCGTRLPAPHQQQQGQDQAGGFWQSFNSLGMSLAASIALSLILIVVFRLPIFILVGFLPLLMRGWNKKK